MNKHLKIESFNDISKKDVQLVVSIKNTSSPFNNLKVIRYIAFCKVNINNAYTNKKFVIDSKTRLGKQLNNTGIHWKRYII